MRSMGVIIDKEGASATLKMESVLAYRLNAWSIFSYAGDNFSERSAPCSMYLEAWRLNIISILAIDLHKLFMGAFLGYFAVFEKENAVNQPGRRKPM